MLFKPAREVNNLMKTLYKVYEETGGEDLKHKQQIDFEQTAATFDALQVLLVSKMEHVREKLNQRDEMLRKSKQTRTNRIIELTHQIRKMIIFIERDQLQLYKLYKKNSKKKRFRGHSLSPNDLIKQGLDLDLIDKHIQEIKLLLRRNMQDVISSSSESEEQLEHANEDLKKSLLFQHAETNSAEDSFGYSHLIVSEENLPPDARDSQLPKINISQQMNHLSDLKSQIDKGLDEFSSKLEQLKEMSKDQGVELDEQNEHLQSIDTKVDKQIDVLELLNKRVDKSIQSTVSNTRLCIILLLLIVFLILLFCIACYLMLSFGF